ncbi:MAG TPA: phosphoglycerate mutase family protein [Thermoanaerobaculia bacterium]|nr:phosphoglycerate mutase family protein [Thermoanaerobaculia bacterium]
MKRFLLALAFALPLFAHEAPSVTTVILVRHAEKIDDKANADPELTDAGRARATELARMLASSGVQAIYVTPFHRTRQTGAPAAKALGLEAVEVKTGKTYAKDVAELIRKQHAGSTVLVVGHSNSTQQVIQELGIAGAPFIPETDYDNFFVVTLVGDSATLLKLKY